MVKPFYRNIRLLVLTIVMIVVWGFVSFQSLPRQEDPELVSRVAVVQTAYPGANAERVEALVTEVIEAELSELDEIVLLSSDSRVGDRKSTRLNSSHLVISYAVFCLKKKKKEKI